MKLPNLSYLFVSFSFLKCKEAFLNTFCCSNYFFCINNNMYHHVNFLYPDTVKVAQCRNQLRCCFRKDGRDNKPGFILFYFVTLLLIFILITLLRFRNIYSPENKPQTYIKIYILNPSFLFQQDDSQHIFLLIQDY